MERAKDLPEDLIDGFRHTHQEHVAPLRYAMGGMGAVEGEDFITGAMEVVKGLREDVILPLQDGVEGPADEAVVAVPDDLAHEAAVLGTGHGQVMFNDRRYFEECGGNEPAQF